MKSVVSRDRKSCKICDLLKSNGQNIPSSPVSACHIISRKATFWKILSKVDALKGNIFCDEAVALLKKKLKSNRFHSVEQYMIALCAQHDKIFTDSLKNTISSEKVERMGQTVEKELQLSLFW